MGDEIVFETNKKRKLFLFNDKNYRVERINESNNKTYYCCYNCHIGRLKGDEGGNITETVPCRDNCVANPLILAASLAKKRAFKECAERIDLTPQTCYDNARRDLDTSHPGAVVFLPPFNSLRSSFRRIRNKSLPAIPNSYETIPDRDAFPLNFQLNYLLNERFLFLDVEYIPEAPAATAQRIFAFMNENSAQQLCHAEKIHLDGTFKVCPPPFQQLLTRCTIRGTEEKSALIPRLYALLPSKSAHCYSFLFNQIFVEVANQFQITRNSIRWRKVSMDFEPGLISSFRNTISPLDSPYPPLQLEGCHFHFAQALYKKLVAPPISLGVEYNAENSSLKRLFRKVVALAFLPTEAVFPTFHQLAVSQVEAPLGDENGKVVDARLFTFLEYILNYWLTNNMLLQMFNCFQ
mmetsp:Transcript_25978/g.37255  ORF Transcript_25978/g.37255 Transcript_25978/m.37255 type:complete len:407 (-) Transcript_25978:566-1786(-)